jgi:hypothetical protein
MEPHLPVHTRNEKNCITVITEKLLHLAFIPVSVVLREGAQASFSHCHKEFRQVFDRYT